ncbi:hypothetical protein BH11BAC3_BH11BAC3_34750 [soil metagenome]
MKTFLLFLILGISCFQYSNGQTCPTPTIATSGSTSFCDGDQVVLTANTGTDSWTKKSDFAGVGRSDAITFTIGNKGYLGLGRSFSFPLPYYTDFWAYDPATDSWTQQADFPGGDRVNPIGFSVGGKGYIGTGRIYSTNTYLKDFWEFDPTTNTWMQKGDFGGGNRYASAAFSVGNRGYICGGVDLAYVFFNDLWEYDPQTDQWTQKASVGTTGRASSVAFNIADKGYVGMGSVVNGGNTSTALKDFWEYTPATDSWTQKADFRGTNYYSANAIFSIGDKGYVSDLDLGKKNLWQYDPAFDAWSLKKSFPGTSRSSSVGFSIGGTGYLCTGMNYINNLKDFWEYKPEDAFIYQWSSGETTPSIKVKTSGIFSITVSNSQGCTATSAYTNVIVGTPFPAPMILADGPTTFCEGRNVTLGVNNFWDNDPAGTTGLDYTYLWSTGETTQSIVVSNAGIYTLRVTNSTGCNQVTDPIEVTVTSVPIPHIIPDSGPTVVFCESSSADLTAIPGTTDPGIRYLWSNGDTTQTITVAISGEFYVTTTDSNGCSGISNVPVYAYAYPTPEIGGIYSVSPDGSGQNNGFIAVSASGFSGDFYYTIDNFATTSSSDYFDNLGPGTYLVGIQDIRYGCRSNIYSVVLSPSASSPLEIVCAPPLVLATNEQCSRVNVEIAPPSTNGGSLPITITSSHPGKSFPAGTTIITWEAKDASGQTATCQQSVTVVDQTPPWIKCPPDMIVQPTTLLGSLVKFQQPTVRDCPGTTLKQIAGPSSGSFFPIGITTVTFSASDVAGNTTTCSFQVKVLNPYCTGEGSNGKMYVCHNGQTICVSLNAVEAHVKHGDKLGECGNGYTKPVTNPEFPRISVFPNPAKGKFTVQLNDIPASDGSLLIMDAKGSIIETRTVKKASFSPTIPVNLGGRSVGLFMVRFINNTGVYTTKIIVE